MLHLAPSILLAAVVAAAQPVPAKRALDAEQKSAADAWVKDGVVWTNELQSLGEKVGRMLPLLLDGKLNGEAVRAEIKRAGAKMDARLDDFKARPSPAFAEMKAYRTLFLDYLVWEGRMFVTMMNDLSRIAEDKKVKREKRLEALLEIMHAQEGEENVWKAKLEAAKKTVYAAINRK